MGGPLFWSTAGHFSQDSFPWPFPSYQQRAVVSIGTMRVVRYFAAGIAVMLSRWCSLAYIGLGRIAEDRAKGWHLYQMPAHATVARAGYVIMALGLPILSALLTSPAKRTAVAPPTMWQRLWFRVVLSALCSALAAFLLAFLTIALMDAGVL
jgi:hypothetical protein